MTVSFKRAFPVCFAIASILAVGWFRDQAAKFPSVAPARTGLAAAQFS
jgi:hypothetical protein